MLFPDRETLRRIPLSEFDINAVIADVYNGFNKGRSLKDPDECFSSIRGSSCSKSNFMSDWSRS